MPVVKHLTADTFGSFVGKYSERLKVMQGKTVHQEAPLIHLQGVTLVGNGVSISADAIAACCRHGIPIVMLSETGDVYAGIYSSGLIGTITTRREQLMAFYDHRGLHLAFMFTSAKIFNQAATLKYWAKNREGTNAFLLDTAAKIESVYHRLGDDFERDQPEDVNAWLMGKEGYAARLYWEGVRELIPEFYGWPGRIGRGAHDPINSLLNYGYGILYAEVERAILMAGLDPYAGFLHADRPGKPSLVLDLIEEFRQIVVDRTVMGLAARNYTVQQDDRGLLSLETRRDYASKILHQLEGKTRYKGSRQQVRHMLQQQARAIATFVRENSKQYTPLFLTD